MRDSTAVTVIAGMGLIAALYSTLLWRQWLARRTWRAGSTMQITRISAYQMALINGGAPRVALTGVVRLLGRKVLAPTVAGVLIESGTFRGELDPVERQVLTAARRPAIFADLLARLVVELKLSGVTRQLRGELVAIGYMRSLGSRAWWVDYLRNMPPFAVMIAAALAASLRLSLTTGARDTLLTFIASAGAAMLLVALPTRVTALGRYIIWSATQHHPDFKTARAVQGEALDVKILGQSVALYGQDALVGSDLAWIPAVLAHAENED